jgi:hypothetical protein
MGKAICAPLALLLLGAPAWAQGPAPGQAPADAPDCARRYKDFFVRVPVIAVSATDQTRANAEAKALFGPRPEVCEAGGYGKFLEGFRAYAGDALRAKPKQRDNMLRAALAVLEVRPLKVPEGEAQAAQMQFNQVKSDLGTTAAGVKGPTAMVDYFLSAYTRSGPPEAVAVTVPGAPEGGVQSVRIPRAPLPPWVVVSIYEALDLQKQKSYDAAQSKLEVVLKWMETAP